MAVAGVRSAAIKQILAAFGLEHKQVRRFVLTYDVNEAVKVEWEAFADEGQLATIAPVIEGEADQYMITRVVKDE